MVKESKNLDIGSSMIGDKSVCAGLKTRDLPSAWGGFGVTANLIKYGRCQDEITVMKVADLTANFVAELNFQQKAKSVKNLDKLQDAIGNVDKSMWLGEIRCLEPMIEFALAENGATTSKSFEKRGARAHSAAENTNACINDVAAKYGSEEVTRATLNSGDWLESVTDESAQNTETSLQVPRKSEESRHAFNEPGENYYSVQKTGETFRFTFSGQRDKASANRVLKTKSSNPIGFGEKIKGLLQSLTNQFKIATNYRTFKHKSTNVIAQNTSRDTAIEAAEDRTGKILSVNFSKNKLAEFSVKSLHIADNTMLRALSTKVTKQSTNVSAIKLQPLNLKNDSLLSPIIHENVESEIFRGENPMFKQKSTTTHLMKKGGAIKSRVQDNIKSLFMLGGDGKFNFQLQSAGKANPRITAGVQAHFASQEQLGVTNMMTRVEAGLEKMVNAVSAYIVGVGRMIAGPLGRVASVAAVVGVIFGIGAVVVPVSEAQAQSGTFRLDAGGHADARIRNVTEPANPGADGGTGRLVTFRFSTSGGTPGSFPFTIKPRINNEATLGEDYIVKSNSPSSTSQGFVTTQPLDSADFTIEILPDDLDEDRPEVIAIDLIFPDSHAGMFQYTTSGTASKKIELTINIKDNNKDIEPTVTSTNYTNGALSLSKDVGQFELEFELSEASGREITINYPADRTNSTIDPANYRYGTGAITVQRGTPIIKIPIEIVSAEAGQTLILDFTLTNAYFSITSHNAGEVTVGDNTDKLTITFVDKPSVSIETYASEVADTDYVESVVTINPAQTEDITVEFTETGATRTNTSTTSVTIPTGKTQITHRQTFTGPGSYGLDLATTGVDAGKFILNPSQDSVSVNVVDDVGLPAISILAIPALTDQTTLFNFTVQIDGTQTEPIPIKYVVTETGTGTTSGYLSLPEASRVQESSIPTSGSVPLPITIDRSSTTILGAGEITISLLPGPGYKLGTNASRVVAIPAHNAGEAPPVITVTGVTVTEGGATANITFSLDKDAPTDGVSITAVVDTDNSTATETTDFTLSTKSVSITSGNRDGSIIVTAVSDSLYEGANETFTLNLTATGGNFSDTNSGSSTISNTITESDDPPVIAVSSPIQEDTAGSFNFDVTLTGETTKEVSIAYTVATSSGATEGTDFNLGSAGPLTFAAGVKTGTIPITILADTDDEGEETIILNLTATNAEFDVNGTRSISDTATAILTDRPIASISSRFVSGVADSDYLEYTVTLSKAPGAGNTVAVAVTNETFPLTLTHSSPVSIAGAATSQTNRVVFTQTYADVSGSTPGDLVVRLASGSTYTVNPEASSISVPITNGSTLPAVAITTTVGSVEEGDSFEIALTAGTELGSSDSIIVNVSITDTGSVRYRDNLPATAEVTISGSNRTGSLTITTNEDNIDYGDGQLTIQLEPGSGYKVGTPRSLVYTVNEDDRSDPMITISGTTITEEGGAQNIDFSLDTAGTGVSIAYTVGSTSSADDPSDYTISSSPVTIGSGTSGSITITPVNDDLDEDNETIVLTLTATGANFSNGTNTDIVTVRITDNDPLPIVTFSDVIVASTEDTFRINFGVKPASGREVSITFDDTPDTADAGDYSLTTTSPLRIPAGSTSGYIEGTIPSDATISGEERFELEIQAANAEFESGPGYEYLYVTLTSLPIISIENAPASITQGHSFSFSLVANPQPSNPLVVNLRLDGSSGPGILTSFTGGENTYTTGVGNVTIPTSGTLPITVVTANPSEDSGDKAIAISMGPDNTAGTGHYSQDAMARTHSVTMKDNTSPTGTNPRVSIAGPTNPVRADLSANADFIITSTPQPTGTIRVYYNVSEPGNFVADGIYDVELSTAGTTTSIPVATSDADNANNDDSTLTVTLLDRADYTIADPNDHQATATITDDEPVTILGELSIASLVDETFLGGDILYTVTLDSPPTGDNTVLIAMEVSDATDSGDFTLEPATLVIDSSGTATGRVRVGTAGAFGTRTPVQVKISDNASYTFNPQMVSVPIVDAPADVSVYIQSPGTVNEGSEAAVEVHVLPPGTTTTDLIIGLSVADFTGRNAEYIDETTLYKVLKAGQALVTIDVPTKAPTAGLLDGLLAATIVDGVGYAPVVGTHIGYTEVYDLNSPADILSVNRESASIVEGQDAVFNISRTRSAGSTGAEVSFQYNLTFSDDNFYGGAKIDVPSTIPAGMDVRKITIPTIDISGSLPASITDIRLSLENTREFVTADYRINKKSDTIDITENLPVVGIKNYPTNITIGHPFTFTVEADRVLANPLPVGLDFSFIPSGLFASIVDSENNAITNSVTIPTTGSIEITVTTAALATPGDQSSQFFDLSPGTGYSVSTVPAERQPTINFLDNSTPSAARPNVALETHSTDTVYLANSSELTFNIIASHVPSADVDVNVLVSESDGNFLTSNTVAPVRLDKTVDDTMTAFTIAIADDDTDVANGDSTITVTLTHGDGYTLVASTATPSNHTTSATVTDGTPPVVLPVITVTGVNITEGGAAADINFSLDKDAGAGGVSITAVVDTDNSSATETDDYTLSGKTVSIAEGSRTGAITVTVVDDGIDEADNETFELDLTATGATFSGGSNTGSVSNTIVDDDDAPVLSVASFAVADSSASTVNFAVTLVGETARDVSIAYVLDATGSSAATEGTDFTLGASSPLVIAAGTKSGVIPISILADGVTGEGAETIVLDLTATNATFAGGSTTETVTGTITDLPIVSLSTKFIDGVGDADYFEYTVTLSEAPGSGNTLSVFVSNDSFPLDLSHNSSVLFTDDDTVETNRVTFSQTYDDLGVAVADLVVRVTSHATYTVNPARSSLRVPILDAISAPTVSVTTTASNVDEGGNFDVVLTASDELASGDTITVNIAVADTGSVTGYFDAYTPTPVTISGNTKTATVNVTTNGDDTDRGDGEITLQVEPGVGYKVGTPSSVAFTINEDDGLPVITVTGVNITEGGAAADISFSLDKNAGAGGVSITAVVDTDNSSATETDDYTLSSKTVSIAEGSRTGTITVTVVVDDIDEADNETFELDLTATGATFSGGSNTGSVSNTIVDNDDAPVISVASFAVADSSASTVNFAVTLVGETARDVSIAYVLDATGSSAATEGTDFTLGASSPLVIAAGTKSGVIPISILADGVTGEGAETIVLDLTATNATFAGGSTTETVTGTITDLPIVSLSTKFIDGVGDADYFEYTVTLSEAPGSGNTLSVFVSNDSFPLDLSHNSSVLFTGDDTVETNRVTFSQTYDDTGDPVADLVVRVTSHATYTINPAQSSLRVPVLDAISAPTVSVTTSAGNVDEGGNFDVVLTASDELTSGDSITVNIAVADTGTVSGYFDAYTPTPVTISGDTKTATVNITTNGDDQDRGDGEITLQVEPGVGYKVGTPSSVAFTINEDDGLPVITVTGVNITEGGAAADISFSLDKNAGAGGVSITAVVDTDNSTATETIDYTLSSTTVSITEGSQTGTITVTVVDDGIDEADNETFVLILTATGATFSGGSNTGSVSNTIVDDDGAPVLSVASFAVADSSASTVNFAVTLVGETARDVSIAYVIDATGSSAATEGTDYTLGASSPLVIAAGTKSGMIPISILADGTSGEGAETIVLDLTATNATFAGGSTTETVTGTITDLPIVSLSTKFIDGVGDADYFEYTVTLSEAPGSGNTLSVFVSNDSFPLNLSHNSSVLFTGDETSKTNRVTFSQTYDDTGDPVADLVVRVTSHATYTINPAQSSLRVPVLDAISAPTVSVTTSAGNVDEGGNFDVVLTASDELTSGDSITVNIAVADTGTVSGYFDAYTPTPVTISGDTKTATVNITTNGDDQDRGDGEITLQVEPGVGYKVGTPSSVAFTINEDDAIPILGQLSIASLVDETFLGGDILYTVTLDRPPTGDNTVSIAMEVSDTGSTGDLTLDPATLEIGSSGTATGRVRVGTTGTFGARTPVQVKISDHASYTFNPQMVDVPIVDAPADVSIYIQAPGNVNEGSSVTVTAETVGGATSTVDLTLGLSVADFAGRTAEYIDETTLYQVLKAGQTSVTFSVPTKAPTTGLLDGVLVATLVDGVGYAPVSGTDVDYIEVFDLDSPADTLTVAGDASSIIEGEDAVFTITRTGSTAEVSFQYNISVTDGNIYGGQLLDNPSTIPADMNERKITITTTEHSDLLADNANIRLTLENSREFVTADYRINQASDTIDVTDNLPVVAFTNYPTNITIGHPFTFTVEADPLPANPLPVGLNFFGVTTGLFVSLVDSEGNTITNSVTVPTTGSIKITVTTAAAGTTGDQESQFFGFSAGTGYTISTVLAENQPTINLLDNSSPTAARPNVSLQTHSTDTVYLASASELTFNIIASDVPTNDVDVNVLVSESGGSFLSSATVPPVRLDKDAGDTMTAFTVAIADDDTDVENGDSVITVTLTHGDGYTLVNSTADPNHTTSATVTDAVRLPELSITSFYAGSTGYGVTEGYAFEFTVTSDIALTVNLPVTIGITDDEGVGASLSGSVVIEANQRTATGTITMNNSADVDAADTPVLEVAITDGTDYNLSSNSSITVSIKDNEKLPVVTIARTSATPATYEEGDDVSFTVTATQPATPVTFSAEVRVAISETVPGGGSFLASDQDAVATVTLSDSSLTGTVVVSTGPADTDEEDLGQIEVTVLDGANYALPDGSGRLATAAIDDPVLPTLTLATDYTTGVLAGDLLLFDVTMSPPPDSATDIMVEAVDAGSSDAALTGSPITVSIAPAAGEASSSTRGQLAVASTGVTGPITLKFPDALTGYTFVPTGKSLNVPLGTQTNTPTLTIADGSAVAEGSNAEFVLTASPQSDVPVTVAVAVADLASRSSTNYVTEATLYLTLPANTNSITLLVPTLDADGAGDDGVVVATLQDRVGYNVSSDVTAYAVVHDEDGTGQVVVNALQTNALSIVEGETATFRVGRTVGGAISTTGSLLVRYDIVETGDILADSVVVANLETTIADGQSSGPEIEIATQVKSGSLGADAGLQIKIQDIWVYPTATYRVGRALSAKVAVTDLIPTVSIVGLTESYTQGYPIDFTVEVKPRLTESLTVPITIDDSGSGVFGTITTTPANMLTSGQLTIPDTGSVAVNIATSNPGDRTGEESALISLGSSSADPTKYSINTAGNGFPSLYDGENPDEVTPQISFADGPTAPVYLSSASSVTFMIESSHVPNPAKSVTVKLSETGNFIKSTEDATQIVPLQGLATPFEVELEDTVPGTEAGESVISVELVHNFGYSLVDDPGQKTTARVTDAVRLPELSIESLYAGSTGYGVTEGYAFEFTVTSDIAPTVNLPVTISITDDEGVGASLSGSVVIEANQRTATGTITMNNSADVDAGDTPVIEVAITDGTDYDLSSNSSITVSIKDNEKLPVVTIARTSATPTTYEEGDDVSFTVTATQPATPVTFSATVRVAISETAPGGGSFLASDQDAVATVTLSDSNLKGTVVVSTGPADTDEEDLGQIEATVLDGANYALPDGSGRLATAAIDDPVLAELKLETVYTAGVLAGDIILFDVTLTPPPANATTIMVEAVDAGSSDAVLTGSPITVSIAPAAGEASSSTRGQLAVASTGVTGPITLKFPDALNGYTFVPIGKSLSVPLGTQTTTPNLTIAGDGAVEEGESAVFTITADNQSNVPVTVEVSMADLSSRIGVDYITEATIYETLPANTSSIDVSILTNENTNDEIDGVVEATLVDRVGYDLAVGATPGYVDVRDDDGVDPAIVTLSVANNTVEEGTDASFTITRTGGDMTNPLVVGYEIEDIGEKTSADEDDLTATIDANQPSVTFPIKIDAKTSAFSAGNITLKIKSVREYSMANYRLGSTTEQMVTVTETSKPVIEISKLANTAAESPSNDADARFGILLRHNAAGLYNINYSISKVGEFLEIPVDPTETISELLDFESVSGSLYRANLTLHIQDDEMYEEDGSVTITLQPSDSNTPLNYVIGSENQQTIPISDNDSAPTITVSDIVVSDANDTVQFEVELSNPTYQEVSIGYTVASGGFATEGTDFSLSDPSPLRINPGDRHGYITVSIVGDSDTNEGEETFTLNLTATNATFSGGSTTSSVTGTITDYPIVSIQTEFERVSDTDYIQYTLMATSLDTGSISVNLDAITDADSKVDASSSELTSIELTSGVPMKTGRIEFNETSATNSLVEIGIRSGGSVYSIDPDNSKISFRVDDGTDFPAVSISGPSAVNEREDIEFTVRTNETEMTRTEDLDVIVIVSEGGTNFLVGVEREVVHIPSHDTSGIFHVNTRGDTNAGGNDGTITATIIPGANYKLADSGFTASVTVRDNGGALPEISLSTSNSQTFLGGDILYRVSMNPPPESGTTVPITIAVTDQLNTSTFTLDPSSLSIGPDGYVDGRISLDTGGTFASRTPVKIAITSPTTGYTFDPPSKYVEVPIVEVPTSTMVSITGPSHPVHEGTHVQFTITAESELTTELVVGVSVADISGRTSVDYVTEDTHYVVINRGPETETHLDVQSKIDSGTGTDGVMVATIVDGVGYTHAAPTNVGYADIYDSDGTGHVEINVTRNNLEIVEGNSVGFQIERTVNGSSSTSGTLTVYYEVIETEEVTSETLTGRSVIFAEGDSSKEIDITTDANLSTLTSEAGIQIKILSVRDDATITGYRVRTALSEKTTVIDKVLPVITVSGNSATEGGTTQNIEFSLDKANGSDPVVITATVDAVNSTAKETTDYSFSPNPVNISSTGQSGSITVTVVDDEYDEASETFILNLTATGATFTSGHDTHTYTIIDDDPEPTVSIAVSKFENETNADTTGTIAVTLGKASGQEVTVPYTISGTATDATDYVITGATGNTGTVTFTPDSGTTITSLTQDIGYTIKGDTDPESEEQFTITLGTPTNADITNQNISSTITIIDDDSGPELNISVLSANAEVHEADNAQAIFTISANKNPGAGFEYRYEVTQEGDFLTTTPSNPDSDSPTFSGSNNSYTASLELDIENDMVAEANGFITVTLIATGGTASDYTLGSNISEKVIVYDNDMPVLSIAGGATVAEGSGAKATFTITSVVDVTERLRVLYRPDDGIGNFLIGDTAGNNQIAFLDFSGGKTATLTLDIADDEVAEEAGMVSVTLLADDASPINYSVIASSNTGSVAVTDDDMLAVPPVVTLTTEPQPAGSTTAVFYVTVPTTQASDLEVVVEYNYRTSADGVQPVTYQFDEWLKSVATIPAVQTFGSVTLSLTPPVQGASGSSGGATGQADQVLQTRLASGASYTPSATEPIGVSGTAASQANPLVSIRSTVGNDIFEFNTLTFEVSASPSGTAISGVDVEVTQTGDFIDTGRHTLTGGSSYNQSVDIPTDWQCYIQCYT